MTIHFDRLMTDLPPAKEPSPNAVGAVQELLGGKFGEISTLMNYTVEPFNVRGREEKRPFYDLSANIAAEEFAPIELVAYAINLLASGTTPREDVPTETPLDGVMDARNNYHFLATRQEAFCGDSMENFWTEQYVHFQH